MRTFAREQKPTQKTRSASPAKVGLTSCGRKSDIPCAHHLQRTIGNQDVQRLPQSNPLRVQPKLRIGAPNDKYEKEADRIANAVVRTPHPTAPGTLFESCADSHPLPPITPLVQRQATPEELEEEEVVQTKGLQQGQANSPIAPAAGESMVHDVLRSPGRPLDTATRAFMESRLGHGFEQVRVHTGAEAAESAQAMNARAYTVGRDIVFGAGQYVPETLSGQHVLAHELAHTIQQAGGRQGMVVQRMLPCPSALAEDDPVPSGWKDYHGPTWFFHCGFRGILEDRTPSPEDPQNECFYDDDGVLVDEDHEFADCRGTPNQYDSASDWWNHTFEDEGGIWARGWGAFWESRWFDLNRHFEEEQSRRLECEEICNTQPWYLRGFCLMGCHPEAMRF